MYSKLKFDKRLRNGISDIANRYIIGTGGRWEPAKPQGARALPWIFTHQDTRKKFCHVWNNTYTLNFNHIPTNCRFACYKVVIKPRTCKETFEVHDIMLAMNHPGKVGMDLRDYTYGAWAGFLYCESVEQGREVYQRARALIPEDIPVILKRGCTEMERLLPSNLWGALSKEDVEFEEQLNDIFSFDELSYMQADWLKNEIKERWIEHAIKIGDPTARETAEKYSDDPDIWQKLVVHSLTYHDIEESEPSEEDG